MASAYIQIKNFNIFGFKRFFHYFRCIIFKLVSNSFHNFRNTSAKASKFVWGSFINRYLVKRKFTFQKIKLKVQNRFGILKTLK